MAKPDLDDGYLKMAHELLAAVMAAHTTQVARVVLFEVFSQIYGPAKLPMATLRPAEIARRTGLQPSNISAAITSLMDRGMLRREGLSGYYFAKDYESWQINGEPVLTPKMASYAAHAPILAMSHRFAKDSQTTEKCSTKSPKKRMGSHIKSAEPDVLDAEENSDLICDPSANRIGSHTAPPYRENGEVVVVVEEEASPEPPERIVSEPDTPSIWGDRPFKPDPADVERVREQVEALDPMAFLGQKVEHLKAAYPLDWILKAFVKAAGQSNRNLAGLANTFLIAAWQVGRWDDPEPFEPRPARVSARIAPQAGLPAPAPLSPFAAKQKRIQDHLKAMTEAAKESSS